jgi:phenylacetate-CoA ligase
LSYIRQTRTAGARVWRDTRADLKRRSRVWQTVLSQVGVGTTDRVLLALPLTWAVADDAYRALLESGALTLATEPASVAEVIEFAPTVLLGTLTDALRLANQAAQQRVDLADGPLRVAVLTAEPGGSIEVTRRTVEDRWGVNCLDLYGLTEVGVIGWGCEQRRDGMHLDNRQLVLEVVEPGSDLPVAAGEVGELVISTPSEWDTPIGRLRTGDLVRLRPDGCGCGRCSAWIEGGVLGRVDEMLPVRGQRLLPYSIGQIVRRHPAVVDFALRAYTVRGECELTVQLEPTEAVSSESDLSRVVVEVAEDLRRAFGMRLHCELVPPGAISESHGPGRRARRLTRA